MVWFVNATWYSHFMSYCWLNHWWRCVCVQGEFTVQQWKLSMLPSRQYMWSGTRKKWLREKRFGQTTSSTSSHIHCCLLCVHALERVVCGLHLVVVCTRLTSVTSGVLMLTSSNTCKHQNKQDLLLLQHPTLHGHLKQSEWVFLLDFIPLMRNPIFTAVDAKCLYPFVKIAYYCRVLLFSAFNVF